MEIKLNEEQAAAYERGEAVTITKPKKVWTPKGGDVYINHYGRVVAEKTDYATRVFGVERETTEQAKHDLPAITLSHLLINYRAEVAPMWVEESDGMGLFYTVYRFPIKGDYGVGCTNAPSLGTVIFPKHEAEILAAKLTSGEVVF